MNSQTAQSTSGLARAALGIRWPSSMLIPSTLPDASQESNTSDVELSRSSQEPGNSTATSESDESYPEDRTQKEDDFVSTAGMRPTSADDQVKAMLARYEEYLGRSQRHGGDSPVAQGKITRLHSDARTTLTASQMMGTELLNCEAAAKIASKISTPQTTEA
jgi:hypothetical protein